MDEIRRKKAESLEIIRAIRIPLDDLTENRKEKMALALLAVANVKTGDDWADADFWSGEGSWALTTREIIQFWNENYGLNVSSGSYDDVRRKHLIRLVQSGLVLKSAGNPDSNTNNPTRRYAVSEEGQAVLRTYGTDVWEDEISKFLSLKGSLKEKFEKPRNLSKISVVFSNGGTVKLSPGPHNRLQKAIIEDFLPRFAPGSKVLYVGDAMNKSLHVDEDRLRELGFFELAHDQLPDVVAYYDRKKWLLLIEAVHSSNPVSKERHWILENLTKNCTAPRVYVSVFRDRASFRKWVMEISWETEVWLSETPDHLIHFNGEKFLGPYEGE